MTLAFLAMWNPIASLLRRMRDAKSWVPIPPESPDRPSREKPNPPAAGTADAPLPGPSDPVVAQVVPRRFQEWAQSYRRVKVNVATAVINVLGEGAADEIRPELMEVNGGLRKFPPVAGNMATAARRLLGIWAALQVVDNNRLSCLLLVDNCATTLMSIRDGVAHTGDDLLSSSTRLKIVVDDLDFAFWGVKDFLDEQSGQGFFKRYLHSERIQQARCHCNDKLSNVLNTFCNWAQHYAFMKLFARVQELQASIALRDLYIRSISQRSQPDAGLAPTSSEPTDSQINDRHLLLALLAGLTNAAQPLAESPPRYEVV